MCFEIFGNVAKKSALIYTNIYTYLYISYTYLHINPYIFPYTYTYINMLLKMHTHTHTPLARPCRGKWEQSQPQAGRHGFAKAFHAQRTRNQRNAIASQNLWTKLGKIPQARRSSEEFGRHGKRRKKKKNKKKAPTAPQTTRPRAPSIGNSINSILGPDSESQRRGCYHGCPTGVITWVFESPS